MNKFRHRAFYLALGSICLAFYSVSAAELYVAKDGSEAYTTIQDAIDAAQAGDTIYVRPGIYDQGGRASTVPGDIFDCKARVLVTKQLNIIATSADPSDTHIVGAPDPESCYAGKNYDGRGTNAVRCVRFENVASLNTNAKPSILKGFTIRDGYCRQYENNVEGTDIIAGHPGGVTARSASCNNFYVTDCVVSNCYGVRGGLVRYGNYVRCTFRDGHGNAGQDVGRDFKAMSCLFLNPTGAALLNTTLVNCTLVDGGAPTTQTSNANVYNAIYEMCSAPSGVAANGEAQHSVLAYPVSQNQSDCLQNVPYPMVAPAAGDFRLRADTPAATQGDAAHIATIFSAIAENTVIDIYKGLDGLYFASTGSIPVGCYAKPVVTYGGALQFDQVISANGYQGKSAGLYAFSTAPNGLMQAFPASGRTFFRMNRTSGFGYSRSPEMDESIWNAYPPAGLVVTNSIEWVATNIYVNANTGSDTEGDGSLEKPFETLAQAASRVVVGVNTLIHAAAGDYNKGSMGSSSQLGEARVAILGRRIRIKGAGRGLSFITGAPSSESPSGDGRGPGAIRCVNLADGKAIVQGFTLRDGYSLDGTDNTASRQGGLAYLSSANALGQNEITDCELIGGVAYRGSVSIHGALNRCIVRNATPLVGGLTRSTAIVNCLFYDNDCPDASRSVNASEGMIYQSTLVATGYVHSSMARYLQNSVLLSYGASSNWSAMTNVTNVVYYTTGGGRYVDAKDAHVLRAQLRFVNEEADDYRLLTTSPAVSGDIPLSEDYWQYPVTDVYGTPYHIANGKTVLGGIQEVVSTVVVPQPRTGSFSGGIGTNVIEKGESITFTYQPTLERYAQGLLVNGVPQAGLTYSYTATSPYAADGSIMPPQIVEVNFSTNWYVNANTDPEKGIVGDDANTGFTPETPWRTLKRLSTIGYVLDGDCVHVAPGDYMDGYVEFTDSVGTSRARVCVPSGVIVVADGGPSVTRIVGAEDATSTDAYKRGPNAVRCAYVQARGCVKNFTLADGRVASTDTKENQMCAGGGLFGGARMTSASFDVGRAEGCVITNCVAGRGGAAYQGALVNCTILDCVGTACTSVGYFTAHVGCFIDYCTRGGNAQHLRNASYVSHCTIGAHNSVGQVFDTLLSTGKTIDNTIVLTPITTLGSNASLVFSNCVLRASESIFASLNGLGMTRIDSEAEAGLDAKAHPMSTSKLVVDKACPGAYTDNFPFETDVSGSQRMYNGCRDIGAYEYDYRQEFAASLRRRIAVPQADPLVVKANDGVLVKKGTLTLAFTPYTDMCPKYDIPLFVTGTGTLVVKTGDTILGTYTAADGAVTLRVVDAVNGLVCSFVYTPGEDDHGGALLSAITGGPKGMMFNFR